MNGANSIDRSSSNQRGESEAYVQSVDREAQRQAQARLEFQAEAKVITLLEAVEESAVAYGKAFPEKFLRLREPGMSLVVAFDEHDQTFSFRRA